jgi:hypothetical protein
MINDIISMCANEMSKEKNKKTINEKIITPVMDLILMKIKWYIIGVCIFLGITLSLILCILFLIIFSGKS